MCQLEIHLHISCPLLNCIGSSLTPRGGYEEIQCLHSSLSQDGGAKFQAHQATRKSSLNSQRNNLKQIARSAYSKSFTSKNAVFEIGIFLHICTKNATLIKENGCFNQHFLIKEICSQREPALAPIPEGGMVKLLVAWFPLQHKNTDNP